jgi:hypothetical protein
MTPEGRIINNRFEILDSDSDPNVYVNHLDMSGPGYIHTWREATPDEIRRNMMRITYH